MTVYRTDCGCVASRPEPSLAELGDDYEAALAEWQEDWDRVATDHTLRCPGSAYFSDALLTYRQVAEQHEHLIDQLARDRGDTHGQ